MRVASSLLLALSLACLAFPIAVIAPVSTQIEDGGQLPVGDVGPGQTFVVSVEPKVHSGGKYGLGGAYDQLIATSLPEGWSSSPSRLYSDPLQADITVPADAKDGDYPVELTLWDEAGEMGLGKNASFKLQVRVRKDVMDMKVEPAFRSVGAGQPARYSITIVNKGIANDVFTLGSSGVRNWEFRRSVYIPSGTSKTVNYELVGEEESEYQVKIWAKSSSSDAIKSEQDVRLQVKSDLLSDYRAVNKGVLLFPLAQAPAYFAIGLLSNLLPS
ncbi:MAG: hypothetical protein N3F07_02450 [Candidatus Micrarchaeota archaeon]|nr:hypothetical protein [Candidatus Micrarchaeota archaeon]